MNKRTNVLSLQPNLNNVWIKIASNIYVNSW